MKRGNVIRHVSHRTTQNFPPNLPAKRTAQMDIVNKEEIENGYKMVFSIARRDCWGGIMQCTISSAAWLRKGSWGKE